MGFLPEKHKLTFNLNTCKGLVPTVSLNVVGLRFVSYFPRQPPTPTNSASSSFSNYTLKYVDASFYQVARGLVLPFTVCTSLVFLHSRPSLRILFSCGLVTLGFFVGVFLDGTSVSAIGIMFGVASSAITATHSVVIKQSLPVVDGSALLLSWYTNLLSAVALCPIILLAGEGGGIMDLLTGGLVNTRTDGGMGPVATFVWGSLITASLFRFQVICLNF